jgi:hypothetical protein
MIKKHDRVVLKTSIPGQGLKTGDVSTVMHFYKKDEAFEVEFLTLHGETVAIATLEASQVRPVQKREITLARLLRASERRFFVAWQLCSALTLANC